MPTTMLNETSIGEELKKLREREGRIESDIHKEYEFKAKPWYEAPIGKSVAIRTTDKGLFLGRRCEGCTYPEKPCHCHSTATHYLEFPETFVAKV